MAIKYSNNAKATLASAINSTVTTITVVDGTSLPTLGAGDVMYLTLSDLSNTVNEIVKCTAISGTTCTIVRGQESTAPLSWIVGSNVQLRLTAGVLETLLDGKIDDSQVLKNVPANALFTDTNTTYSVGDGGLTTHNFTTTDHNKLNGIQSGATADQDLSALAPKASPTFTGTVNSPGYFTTSSAAHTFTTAYGNITLGPGNSSWGHIQTDRGLFYMNKSVHVNGGIYKYVGGAEYWHPNNDGSGSGLDADTLDGQQGSYYATGTHLHDSRYMRKDSANTISNYSYLNRFYSNTNGASTAGGQSSLEVYTSGAGNDAFMAFHVGGDYATYFGLDGDTNDLFVGGWIKGASRNKIWHQGNDGSGSGLDADLLDGVQGSGYAKVLGRVVTNCNDAAYRIPGMYGFSDVPTNGTGKNYSSMVVAANIDTGLQIAGGYSNNELYFRGWSSYGSTYYAWHKLFHTGNDGSGSGLDADLLDGQQGSYYSPAHSHPYLPITGGTLTGNLAISGGNERLTVGGTTTVDTIDGNRPNITLMGGVYPHMTIDSRNAGNTGTNGNHGPVFSFVQRLSTSGYRRFAIGTAGYNGDRLSFGYADNNPNPHHGMGIDSTGGMMYLTTGAQLIVNGSVSTPILYDKDNTAYYTNPASNSHLNMLSTAGTITTPKIIMTGDQSRGKLSVWAGNTYGIGMGSGYNFGGLVNEYAMTFQMSNTANRGFWWGDSSHTNSQGAMSLTTTGKLTVASGIRVGYGETDTTAPVGGLQVSGIGVSNTSFRAPIFYDTDNTAYYTNPASNSHLNTLSTAGTITAPQFHSTANGTGMNYKVGDDAWIGDTNVANTIRIQGNQSAANGYISFGSSSNTTLGRAGAGALTWGGNTVWHSGNDGSGSGLDADLLDGYQGSEYVKNSDTQRTGDAYWDINSTKLTSAEIRRQLNTTNTNIVAVDDGTAPEGGCFQATGYVSLMASDYWKIDEDATYQFEVWVKFISGTGTSQLLYAGWGAYDVNKSYFGNTNRYWGASSEAFDADSRNDGVWHKVVGRIGPGQFTAGTEYAKPLLLLNYSTGSNVTRYCGLKMYRADEKLTSSIRQMSVSAKNGTVDGHISTFLDSAGNVNTAGAMTATGIVTSSASHRAPIFYDTDNTAYYTNPASNSHLNTLTLAGTITQSSVGNSKWPYLFTTSAVGNDNASGFWTSSSGYPDMRLRKDGSAVKALISSWERSHVSYGFDVTGTLTTTDTITTPRINVRPAANAGPCLISFSDNIPSAGQNGTIEYTHSDANSLGAGESFHVYGTETSLNFHVAGTGLFTGNVTAYYSDERLKDFEGTIPNALDKVKQLNGYYYKGNDVAATFGYDTEERQVGVSAQEVEAVLPEIVVDAAIGEGYKTVQYDKLVPLLIEAVKELTAKVESLETQLSQKEIL